MAMGRESGAIRLRRSDAYIDLRYGSHEAAIDYASRHAAERQRDYDLQQMEVVPPAARGALTDGVLDRAMNMSERLRRDLSGMLADYAALQNDS
jgi:hypothetical protein